MLNQQINALALARGLYKMMREDDEAPRMSLLDFIILLTINELGSASKNDILEHINNRETSKSFIDRPAERLLKYKLIEPSYHEHAKTKAGEARVTYSISKLGNKFLRSCKL